MQQDVVEFFVEEDRQEFTRNDFIQQLGLQWDPFLVPVAEQELIYSNQGASLLFFFVSKTRIMSTNPSSIDYVILGPPLFLVSRVWARLRYV